jgi:hypothetical protein
MPWTNGHMQFRHNLATTTMQPSTQPSKRSRGTPLAVQASLSPPQYTTKQTFQGHTTSGDEKDGVQYAAPRNADY